MSVTDELRRLLDERGVEYDVDDTQVDGNGTMYRVTYVKEGYGRTWVYEEPPDCDLLVSYNHDLGAEDAIEATLGRGECHDVGDPYDFCCSECGARMFIDTGETYTMIDSLGNIIEKPSFCPSCGSRIKED